MFEKNCIPKLYTEMVARKYTNKFSDQYIWLFELEWMSEDDVINYEYEEGESLEILPFGFTGHGDKWVFVNNDSEDPYVGRCYLEDTEGNYYAKNLEDTIIKNIIEFVSSSSFYINENDAESYQMSSIELKNYLEKYCNVFEGILKYEYIELIKDIKNRTLKKCNDDYCEWYALLSIDEADTIIKNYLDFELMDAEFEWYH